jgi:formamidopyrimidine-DNA glycosylase
VPELPEVETVRRGLERHVVGRTIETVQVLHPRAVRRDPAGPAGFEAAVAGRLLTSAQRRGKYLWLTTDDGEALLAHLGMSGQLLVGPPDRPLSPHVRIRFTFTDGGPDLRFTDQRTFGYMALVPFAHPLPGDAPPPAAEPASAAEPVAPAPEVVVAPSVAGVVTVTDASPVPDATPTPDVMTASGTLPMPVLLPAPIAHIAPDPLEPAFDAKAFATRLVRRHTGVKRALLDQSLISGVGNIYADEALWRAKLHWARPTETLKRGEVTRLLNAVDEVLCEALGAGGTSFDSLYVDVNGESGYFDRKLAVYGREGLPCYRCGTPIRRDAFMNRSAYSCPHCQPRPRRAHW